MGFLVVVKRDEPSLYDYLQRHFDEPDVQVVMDRRVGDRRHGERGTEKERRRRDRRVDHADQDRLWEYGFRVALAQAGWC
jgi:hypothetical protein